MLSHGKLGTMIDFSVKQEAFSGPLGLLLELLEEKTLQISDVALAQIADAYLATLEERDVPHEELADFLLVASRLIYLKSRALMPFLRIEEEEEGMPLEEQLRVYRVFMEAAERIQALYVGGERGFAPTFLRVTRSERTARFLPPTNAGSGELHAAFLSVLKRLEPFFALQEVSIARVKSVEERIAELHETLRTRASVRFRDVIRGATSRADVVVSFLALLELMRRHIVKASQKEDNEIVIERTSL